MHIWFSSNFYSTSSSSDFMVSFIQKNTPRSFWFRDERELVLATVGSPSSCTPPIESASACHEMSFVALYATLSNTRVYQYWRIGTSACCVSPAEPPHITLPVIIPCRQPSNSGTPPICCCVNPKAETLFPKSTTNGVTASKPSTKENVRIYWQTSTVALVTEKEGKET